MSNSDKWAVAIWMVFMGTIIFLLSIFVLVVAGLALFCHTLITLSTVTVFAVAVAIVRYFLK